MLCYCSHLIQCDGVSQCPSMDSLSLPGGWHKRSIASQCLQANSKCKFFTSDSLLDFVKLVESVNCSYFPTLFMSHIQHFYFRQHDDRYCTNEVYKMPFCSYSSVDTHTSSVENIITACVWIILCIHGVEERLYSSFIPDGETYCVTR